MSAVPVGGSAVAIAAVGESTAVARIYGEELDINPHVALLAEIRRTAGHVSWLGMKLQEAPHDDALLEEFRPWLNLYQKERDRLTRICADAIKIGLSERIVRLEERRAEMVARVLMSTLEALAADLPPEVAAVFAARAPMVLRQQLMALDSGV